MSADLSPFSQQYVDGLNERLGVEGEEFNNLRFEATAGGRYDRIVKHNPLPDGSLPQWGGSAHAFVERETGHVYKPDGWKRPAKGIRFTTIEAALEAADQFGGYLYSGRA